jgi:hypothetical protein
MRQTRPPGSSLSGNFELNITMGSFDQTKAYAPQEDVFFDDGREIELLHFVYSHPKIDKIRGSPKDVLAAIDEFGRTKKYLMNVGEDKGRIVFDLITDVKPKTMVSHSSSPPRPCCLMLYLG